MQDYLEQLARDLDVSPSKDYEAYAPQRRGSSSGFIESFESQLQDADNSKYELAIAMLMLCLSWERFEAMVAGMNGMDRCKCVHRWAKTTYANEIKKI